MQIASFSPPPPLLFPRPRFAVHCLASRGLGGAATCSLHFFTFVPLSHCLPIGVPIVRSLARPPSPPQHKSVPGHSRHSTDAPNNDPLWKLPPICYLNSETASEVREVTGAAPRHGTLQLQSGASKYTRLASNALKNTPTR